MKTQPAKPKHVDLLEEGWCALTHLRNREKCLRVAIAEGIYGLTPDASLDEAQQLLRRAAREHWECIHYEWAPKGCACFDAQDGTTYIFPI
ncbi:MAG TPA: hypothetical protein DDW41_03805 [Candidatus Andersenbacteria bacterium]|nr:MAG: hypothetical protein UW94_C0014G0014 [Parcubacteria group bacterium GW2011_GWA2_45_14]OGY33983.1 MAG: hypothetical protein A3B76_02240 [Candidatus Andersenbacteria bacterium RIFCSPHIGHO2_02_FULL_46_16]OGY37570.1 MAG: hypothetical protein A3I08_04175 [Candidatus Andersenbacteria bacterium RIFCSPLOWO2_02_FULL_46_11]HBE90306.1 hypothetical protein [Candidatus Andersenbacteria bacterium]